MASKKLVALGDSVVWGQGNRPTDKFAAIVSKQCKLVLAPIVAHSGARITPQNKTMADYGEVPLDSPGIFEQIPQALRLVGSAADVSVVLLNGGINDVPAANILLDETNDLATRINSAFEKFPTLLEQTVAAFPSAKVVALGYYPLVSDKTHPKIKLRALHFLGPASAAARIDAGFKEGRSEKEVMDLMAAELGSMADNCRRFVQMSNDAIQRAVAPTNGRAVFAAPKWRPEYSLGLSRKTRLWLGVNDSVFGERLGRYRQHVEEGKLDWPVITVVASFGHPNIPGAKLYADAIVTALGGRRRAKR